jgi:hypothetical protein
MDRMSLSDDWRDEVASHQVAGRQVKLPEPLVIQLGRTHPWIQAKGPERLALIDVANTSADALLQQQLPKGGCVRAAGTTDDLLDVEWIDQDIRSQVRHRLAGIANQLHKGRGEADCHQVIET